jgi:hypothetical protein
MALTLTWNDGITLVSLVACVLGLVSLWKYPDHKDATELEMTESTLLMMSFAYWGVHCFAIGVQKLPLPTWDVLLMSLKFTAVFTYFLTAACILSLPLTRFASSQQVQE